MKSLQLTQQQLSVLSGIPRGRISEYVTGRRKPSLDNLKKINAALLEAGKGGNTTTIAQLKIDLLAKGPQAPLVAGKDTYSRHIDGVVEDMLDKLATAFGYELYELADFLDTGQWERPPFPGCPPLTPETKTYLAKAQAILESPKGAALKVVLDGLAGRSDEPKMRKARKVDGTG